MEHKIIDGNTGEVATQLTLFDYQQMDLDQLEGIIARGIGTFIEVGLALLAIREGRKYKKRGYSDFNVYIKEQWGMSLAHGSRLLNAGYIATEIVQVLPIGNTSPAHESQIRPLTRLGTSTDPAPELWIEAWIAACELAEGELPTAKEVKFVVDEMLWADPPPPPPGEYRVIYADPPWQFDNSGFEQSAASHYLTMSTEDICNMNIPKADNSVLFMWATNAMLEDALKAIKAWGFEYKTNFVWTKTKGPTMGFHVMSRHELLMIGTRGSGMLPEVRPISIITGEVTKHSKKPDKVYKLIEEMYDGPYIELFARQAQDGWDRWGNEANPKD